MTSLNLGKDFSHSLDGVRLPPLLTHLYFACNNGRFRHSIHGVDWPSGLQLLQLPDEWNQPVEGLRLPDSLTHLHFGSAFRQSLRHWHPPASLTDFRLSEQWGGGLGGFSAADLRLPPTLTKFVIPPYFWVDLADLTLPPTLQSLTLGIWTRISNPSRVQLPAALTSLDLCYVSGPIEALQLPPLLTHLKTGTYFTQPLLDWDPPASLTHLELCGSKSSGGWNLPVSQLRLPPNLRRLGFGAAFNHSLAGLQFSASLTSLEFHNSPYADFKQPLTDWTAMPALRHLTVCGAWHPSVSDLRLPPQLESLTFRMSSKNDVLCLRLPATLLKLQVHSDGRTSLRGLQLPSSLRELILPGFVYDRALSDLPSAVPPALRVISVHHGHRGLLLEWLALDADAMPRGCVVNAVD